MVSVVLISTTMLRSRVSVLGTDSETNGVIVPSSRIKLFKLTSHSLAMENFLHI